MQIYVETDPASAAAAWIARRLRRCVGKQGGATVAVSGGSTAPPMFAALLAHDVPWEHVTVWQVDERVVPDGDPERNAEQLTVLPCRVRPMPVTARDLRAAARRYAAGLPDRFDIVHLGLGDDGHTASWPPGDEATMGSERKVEVVEMFNGFPRMTLTPAVVNGAAARMMLTHGPDKAPLLQRWFDGDRTLPVGRVRRTSTVCVIDPAARPGISG